MSSDDLRKLSDRATPGPWRADANAFRTRHGEALALTYDVEGRASARPDAAYVVALVNAHRAGDVDESDAVTRERMSALLTGTANVLKGEPGPLAMHGWDDLPAVAADLKAENARLRAQWLLRGDTLVQSIEVVDNLQRDNARLRAQVARVESLCDGTTVERPYLLPSEVRIAVLAGDDQ